jgi:hypothetical protein
MPKKQNLTTEKGTLTNRGGAGLLTKVEPQPNGTPKVDPTQAILDTTPNKVDNIRCVGKVVPIAELTPDPDNARVHGDRNMRAITASLKKFGQMKPIVVREQDLVVAAGNGTLAAAVSLGWSKIAASVIPMTDTEFVDYGLADNKTAELASWDFEVVARLDKFLHERGENPIGWTADELEVMRAADWTPPPLDEGAEFGSGGKDEPLVIGFTPDQYHHVGAAIAKVKEREPEFDQAQALTAICQEFLTESGDAQKETS